MNSNLRRCLAMVLSFRTIPVTTLVVLVYFSVYISVLFTDRLPDAPTPAKQHGLGLDVAYADLHKIARVPHPYNSHQNDIVRTYVLDRVREIAAGKDFVDVADDRTSNVTFGMGVSGRIASYFEGNNVLVRVQGKDPSVEGVLVSAHFDSVSTAPGATDNGMGVATGLALAEYFSKHRPRRTIVFNFNNGEEDGLHGAHAFLEHSWFKLIKDFVNLEGAGSGGRPTFVRSTSTRITRAWSSVPHPHGMITTADAFARHLVKSDTDYSVYTVKGREGIDFAFYRQRSKYHTKEDSIPSLGGKNALWNMMESTLFGVLALDRPETANEGTSPVYFDLFGEAFAVTSLTIFYVINIMLLILGPLIVLGLVFFAYREEKLHWDARGWGRTPIALIISAAISFGFTMLVKTVNPLIIHSSSAMVFLMTLSAAFLSFHLILSLFDYLLPVTQERSILLAENTIFWWILLVLDTVAIGQVKVGGLYFVTFFYTGSLAALVVGLLGQLIFMRGTEMLSVSEEGETGVSDQYDHESTERTPLLAHDGREDVPKAFKDSDYGIWILQFLLAVPFPLILITQISVSSLNGLNQTLVDGSLAIIVYIFTCLLSLLSLMPLLPFMHKIHRSVSYVLALLLVISILYNALAFPFSVHSPYKTYFQQTMDLDSGNNTVQLTGINPWVERYILRELPSTSHTKVNCSVRDHLRAGLPTCEWPGLPPHVAPGNPSSWVTLDAKRTGHSTGTFKIEGKNTRACRIYFNQDTPAIQATVRGGTQQVQSAFPLAKDGVRELRMWSREWDRVFEVDVVWYADRTSGAPEVPLKGRVACEWVEQKGIPAYGEVESFLPEWALVTKRTDGLFEGYKDFELS